MSRIGQTTLRGIGLLALVCLISGWVHAQETDSTLFLMVRAGPSLNEQKIASTLTKGLKEADCTINGTPIVKMISPAVYEEVEGLITAAPGTENPEAVEAVSIRSLPTREPISEFRLKSPSQILKTLKVKYRKAGEMNYKPTAPEKNGPLTLIVPGRYALKLEADDQAISYEAVVSELGKKDDTLTGEWPARDRFFVVTMRKFRGNKDTLFRVVQDENRVANPLKNIRLGRDFTFVFANMDSVAPDAGPIIDGNELIVKVPAPNGRSPRRVWMMFPLEKEEMLKQRDAHRKFDSEELPTEIRKNAVSVDQDATITAESTAKWIEIPPEPGNPKMFMRRLPLKDLPKIASEYPTVHRLLVWEFDRGTPEAIEVQHPVDGRAYLLEEEMKIWPTALKRSIEKKDASDKKEPSEKKQPGEKKDSK